VTTGIVQDYEASFAKLKSWPVDVFLAPHPEFFRMQQKRALVSPGAANPFIDSKEFPAYIARSEADFHTQLAAQQSSFDMDAGP
jgi:metallo-beta-lactamase class B